MCFPVPVLSAMRQEAMEPEWLETEKQTMLLAEEEMRCF